MLPRELLDTLEGLPGFNRTSFESVHTSGEKVTSIRLNPYKVTSPEKIGFRNIERIPWTKDGYYLATRPSFTFDPHFHAGCYYVQEASSMFVEQVFLQTISRTSLRVLDLCAAPGGKSTHLLSLLGSSGLLVSNELIRSRVNILTDNITKWGCSHVIVTNNDARDFARLPAYFDVIVVDAPCSGSGLFRREPSAVEEWSENNVALCCQRQQRILSDVLPSLKQDGILIYSTCSYSKEEDEDVANWLIEQHHLQSVEISVPAEWGIVRSRDALRFYPDKVRGEGFFIAAFRKIHPHAQPKFRSTDLEQLKTTERNLVHQWAEAEQFFFRSGQTICAVPASMKSDVAFITGNLKAMQVGLQVGEVIREKFIPHHMLAMSGTLNPNVPVIDVDLEHALRYLQRKEVVIEGLSKGWHVVRYNGYNLGWINVLQNRVNNYYPKEMRILKQ